MSLQDGSARLDGDSSTKLVRKKRVVSKCKQVGSANPEANGKMYPQIGSVGLWNYCLLLFWHNSIYASN